MPMLKLEIDYREVEKYVESLGGAIDQVPFAMMLALNQSAETTRNFLIQETWPQSVKARNSSFIAASLTTRQARASKQSLSVEIYDKLDRGNLLLHAQGGTRTTHGGSNLAIPSSQVPRSSLGVTKSLRPKNLGTAGVRRGDVLYKRDARGRLKLLYVLKPTSKVPQQVPFFEDYRASMQRELHHNIPLAVKRAMATRRKP